MTIMLDADQQPINETFYPYYGSSQKQTFLPTPQQTFQSRFRPYTSILAAPAAPAFVSGFPSAYNITPRSFALQAHIDQQVDSVTYIVLESTTLEGILPNIDDVAALRKLFAEAGSTYVADVVATGAASIALGASGAPGAVLRYQASITVGASDNGGSFAALIAIEAGCRTTYAVLTEIRLPDAQPPSFVSVDIQSDCENLVAGTDQAVYQVQVVTNEPAEVCPTNSCFLDLELNWARCTASSTAGQSLRAAPCTAGNIKI